jgi:hypothetical protein
MSTATTDACLVAVAERLDVFVENELIGLALIDIGARCNVTDADVADLKRRQQRVRVILLAQLRALFEALETVH